jgi:hypothetical protein
VLEWLSKFKDKHSDLIVIKRHIDMRTCDKQGQFNNDHACIEVVTHSRQVTSLVKLPIDVNKMTFTVT